jgi:hypothetical protein
MTIHQAYQAFKQADEQWSAALKRVFGKQAGDKRYTIDGETHPACAEAYKAFKQTGNAWRRLMDESRRLA